MYVVNVLRPPENSNALTDLFVCLFALFAGPAFHRALAAEVKRELRKQRMEADTAPYPGLLCHGGEASG